MSRTSRLVLLRLLGLLILALLALTAWAVAHAEETEAPPPIQLNVSPNGSGQQDYAPGGTVFENTTPKRNLTRDIQRPPHSPTPPNYPFGIAGGSWAPAFGTTTYWPAY
jgi:hypothetical protein